LDAILPTSRAVRGHPRQEEHAMKIEAVDFFYLAMPEIEEIGDGSQDVVLVRVRAGGYVGWGECESSPLPTIAALVCPKSHSACHPVQDAVLGQELNCGEDIARIGKAVHELSLDMLQHDHALSGIDVAMWDLLGRRYGEPVYRLLGYERAYPKLPYASVLFGDTAQETLDKAQGIRAQGFRAAKFGWGPYGRSTVQADADQVAAAREGLGPEGIVLIDAGTVWYDDLEAASARLEALGAVRATWLEEPFVSGALAEYKALSRRCKTVKLAGGEGSHNYFTARHMIDYAGLGYVQIDAGRIGGLTPAKRVADYAAARGVTYVNHTFTSHLALCASIQPMAGLRQSEICEYPVELKPMAWELTTEHLLPDAEGYLHLPEGPGLGLEPDTAAMQEYLLDVEITVQGQTLYRTPSF
jgi:L-alanine-DL-glutamate epimerase-like enolase superfamily enzyme